MAKRIWNQWPSRFKKQLLDRSIFLNFAGIGISIAGVTVSSLYVLYIGIAVFSFTLLFSAYNSFPPKMRSPREIVGERVSVSKLDDLYPKLFKFGVIGNSQTGKSTFIANATHVTESVERTNRVYASVIALQKSDSCIALIDGDGKQIPHQFEIVDECDLILLFVDHNSDDSTKTISKKRLEEHIRFLEQLIFYIKNKKIKIKIHVVINKSDLWLGLKVEDDFRHWLEEYMIKIQDSNIFQEVSSFEHSNNKTNDLSNILSFISKNASDYDA